MKQCPECKSKDLEWSCGTQKISDVVDGRLTMHDVGVIFFLGCNECSETVAVVDGDKIAGMLNSFHVLYNMVN